LRRTPFAALPIIAHDALMDLYRLRFDIQIEVASTEGILGCWQV
jgi:hypothetical protein